MFSSSKFNTIKFGQNLDSEYFIFGHLLDHNIVFHQIMDKNVFVYPLPEVKWSFSL